MFFICRKNIVDPEDPRCARLTLTGRMITVPPGELEFAKQAMFSRYEGALKTGLPEAKYGGAIRKIQNFKPVHTA